MSSEPIAAPAATAAAAATADHPEQMDPTAVLPISDSDDDDDGRKQRMDSGATDLSAESPTSPTTTRRRQSTTKIFAEAGGVRVSWQHLTYKVTMPDATVRTILDNISGGAVPGRVLAVIGPSGAGKTSMLNAIGARLVLQDNARLDGVAYLNDVVLSEKHKPIVSFVVQDDIVMPKESIADAFRFSASMRNADWTEGQIEQKVEDMLRDLKLTEARDTLMGVPGLIKGVSGGEKRRTNIGVELINNPPVIFLDEPTSGLDSVAAYRVGRLLRELAHIEQRTVVCTIHSPSSELFDLFDDLLLLAHGMVVYHGPAHGVREYFESIHRPMPERVNPSEFAMKLLQAPKHELQYYYDAWRATACALYPDACERLDTITEDAFVAAPPAPDDDVDEQGPASPDFLPPPAHPLAPVTESPAHNPKDVDPKFLREFGVHVRESLAPPPAEIHDRSDVIDALLKERKPPSASRQFALLSGRGWRNVVRDPMLFVGRTVQTIVFALFIGLVYFGLDLSAGGVQDRAGGFFLIAIQATFLSLMPALMAFPPELAVFLQDQSNGLYGPGVFYWAKALVELPINTIIPILFGTIIYLMSAMVREAEQFFIFIFIIILFAYNANALGMCIGAFAGRKPEAAFVYAPLIVMPQAFVAGLFANTDRLDPGWTWLSYISFVRYGYKEIMRNEFMHLSGKICAVVSPACRWADGMSVINFYGFDEYHTDTFGYNVLFMIILMVVMRVFGQWALSWQASGQHTQLVFAANYDKVQKIRAARGASAAAGGGGAAAGGDESSSSPVALPSGPVDEAAPFVAAAAE